MVLPKILVVILSCCSALGSKRTTQNFGKVFSSGEGEITTLTKACCTEDFIAHIHFEAAAPPEKFAIILPPSKVLPIKEKFLKRNSDKRFKAEIDLAQMTNVTEPTEIFLQIGGAEKIRLRRCRSKRSSFDYHCSVRRDDFCRCNLNSRLCCTSDPKHQGPFSCQECIDRNEDNCDFCDQNGRKCMTFEKSQNYAADICTLPKEIGGCKASLKRWYYDNESQECDFFYYGGCDGNANRFTSRSQCQKQCENVKPLRKAFDGLLETCLDLGASLLEDYDVTGQKRRRKNSNFKREFDDISCRRF